MYHRRLFYIILTASAYSVLPSIAGGLGLSFICSKSGHKACHDKIEASFGGTDCYVAIVPSICATDAPCTGLSVIYQDDGSFDSYLFYPRNPEVVIVDTAVIAASPVKFLVAGMGDALGTYFEARACQKVDAPSLENGGITRSAMALCELCYKTLLEYGVQAKEACEFNLVTAALEAIVEANTYLSGVGADNGGLAVAHSVYNG